MKAVTFLICILLLSVMACKTMPQDSKIPDGLYLIARFDSVGVAPRPLATGEKAVYFSKMFAEYQDDNVSRIIVDTRDYVPLDLKQKPVTEQETDQKKKLLLSLSSAAADKLKAFTEKNLMHMVVVVVDGEVLTQHKIKAAITGGQLQITRCTDNACERLYVKLKNNVKQ